MAKKDTGGTAVAEVKTKTKAKAAPVQKTDAASTKPPVTSTPEADKLRQEILDKRSLVDNAYWDLAGDLQRVWKEDLYLGWGFADFATYASQELGYKPRSAQYLVTIADYFGTLPAEIQDWVKSLGWSKAKELVGRVKVENWLEIKDKIEGLSVVKIIEFFKGSGNKGKGDGTGSTAAPSETQRKAFALFPAQVENVEKAIELAKSQAKSDKDGHALDLICTSFMSQGGGDTLEVLRRMEKMSGLRFVAYDPNSDSVIYGQELIDAMSGEEPAAATG